MFLRLLTRAPRTSIASWVMLIVYASRSCPKPDRQGGPDQPLAALPYGRASETTQIRILVLRKPHILTRNRRQHEASKLIKRRNMKFLCVSVNSCVPVVKFFLRYFHHRVTEDAQRHKERSANYAGTGIKTTANPEAVQTVQILVATTPRFLSSE